MNILAFFTDNNGPVLGLSPTIRIRDVSDGSLVVTDDSMTEIGDGNYSYDFVTYNSKKDYAIRCDGGASLSNNFRYKHAGNESYVDDIWSAPVSAYPQKSMAGAFQSLLYGDYIFVDETSPWSGTSDFGLGTKAKPLNNITDAVIVADSRNIDKLMLLSDITVGAADNISKKAIETIGIMGTDVTLTQGCSANGSVFRNLNLQGTLTNGDVILIYDCQIFDLQNFSGIMNNVAFSQSAEISIGTWATIAFAMAGGTPVSEPEIDIGAGQLNIYSFRGDLKLKGKTGDNKSHIGLDGGHLNLTSTCVSGNIHITGVGVLESDNSGPNCQVDSDELISNVNIADFVWEENLSDHDATSANMAGLLQRIGGLVHENIYIDNPVYDGDGNLTSARLRIYSAPGSVGTANDVIGTYQITAPGDGAGRFTTWKQVKT